LLDLLGPSRIYEGPVMVIAVTHKKRLWSWDFSLKECVCMTDRIMVHLFDRNMTIAMRPELGLIRLPLCKNPTPKQETVL
jgi:hypothetical protein